MKTAYMHHVYMGNVGDMKNLEYHFTRMAEKGWMIDKIGLLTHRYRAIEPCKKSFFVDLLPQITAFDYPENEDAQDYRSFCEASGWTFVAANKQFHVFCAEDNTPAPTPIHTDNCIQARIYLKASKKYELPIFLYSLFMIWFFSPLGKGIELFLSNMMLFMAMGYCFFSVGYLWNFCFVIRWFLRTRKSAKHGLPMPVVNYRLARIRINVFSASIILFLACTVLGVVLDLAAGLSPYIVLIILLPILGLGTGLWIRRQIDTRKRTRGANIGLTIAALVIMELVIIGGMVFTISNLINIQLYPNSIGDRSALTLRDFGMVPESNSALVKRSAAVPDNYSYWEVTRGGSVNTEVYRSVSNVLTQELYKHYADEFERRYKDEAYSYREVVYLTSSDAAIWGADEGVAVFSGYNMELLLHRGKTILRLSIGIEGVSAEEAGQVVQGLWCD